MIAFDRGNIIITDTFTNSRILQEELAEYGSMKLVYEGSDDKYQTIMASQLHFSILVNESATTDYLHLTTASEGRYKVELKVYDENDVYLSTLWTGYLLPDQFSEPYVTGKYFINFIAIDGLSLLKGSGFNRLNQFNRTSLTTLLSNILTATGVQFSIYIAPAIENAITDVLVGEIEIDTAAYLEKAPDKDDLIVDYYVLLNDILTVLGCRIFQYKSAWYIVGINRLADKTINFEEYNYLGVYVQNINITRDTGYIYFRDQANVTLNAPFKSVIVDWDANERENVFYNDIAFQPVSISYPWSSVLGITAQHWESNFANHSGTTIPIVLNDKDGFFYAPPQDSIWKTQAGYVSYDMEVASASLDTNYMSLSTPVFVAPAQEYSFKCTGTIRFANNALGSVNFAGGVLYELLLNDTVILSNKSPFANNTVYDFEYNVRDYNVDFNLEVEIVNLQEPGFIDIRFYAFNSDIHLGHSYTVLHTLELKKKEEIPNITTVEGSAFSSINKTTKPFFGSSLTDLTKRKLYVADSVPYAGSSTTIPAFEQEVEVQLYVEKPAYGVFTWHMALISASDYNLLLQYQNDIELRRGGTPLVPDSYVILDHDPTDNSGNFSGYWFAQLVGVGTVNTLEDGDEIWIDKPEETVNVTIRNYLFEKWKPFGSNSGNSAQEAIASVYLNSVPEHLYLIEGNALGLHSPLDVLEFNYLTIKEFVPLRLTIDLVGAETNLLMIEPRNEVLVV